MGLDSDTEGMETSTDPVPDPLERALETLWRAALSDAAIAAELAVSRASFFGGAAPSAEDRSPEAHLALRRYAEWFLLERPSEALGGVPVEVFAEELRAELGSDAAAVDTLLGSRAGVFSVTEELGESVARDLLGSEALPLAESIAPGAAPSESGQVEPVAGLLPGDLLVGRLFQIDGSWLPSPASLRVRSAELLEAVRRDVEALRPGRRSTLRISQLELERMFHPPVRPAAPPAAGESSDPAAVIEAARNFLAGGGLSAEQIEAVFAALRAEPHDPECLVFGVDDALGRVLEGLAFETELDLGTARQLLLAAWHALGAPIAPAAATVAPAVTGPADRATVGEALAAFDRGRAEGRDIELLFRELEASLGLPTDADEEEDSATPDFPGVVGAMVEEFLWDVGRERGERAAAAYGSLRAFASFAAEEGVFENLGPQHLLEYCARYLVEAVEPPGAEDATELLAALRDFSRWCEEQHSLELWSGFAEAFSLLRASLPRVCEANRLLERSHPSASEPDEVFELVEIEGGGARLAHLTGDAAGEELRAGLPAEIERWLRPGDLLRGALGGGERLRVVRCYPPEARPLLV